MSFEEKRKYIREMIIQNAKIYRDQIAGNHYMYIYKDKHLEISFEKKQFLHLTGVDTNLSANEFYKLANKNELRNSQLLFNSRFPLAVALKKVNHLNELPELVHKNSYIIENFVTETFTYPYVITNKDLSILIGISETNGQNFPKSFRVKGNIYNKALTQNIIIEEIEIVLKKKQVEEFYDTVVYKKDNNYDLNNLPEHIIEKISSKLFTSKNISEIIR